MAEGQINPGSGLPILATPIELPHFDQGVTLGTGSFGRVRFVTHKTTGSHWAIKMLKKAEVIRLQQVEHMLSEKAILACLDHPFIVKLAGTFQDKKYLYMVLEYIVGGEFFTHLRKAGRFENPVAKFYAAQIVTVFEYLHNQDFIYRDLKPENLLLDVEGYVKITDFGFAKLKDTMCVLWAIGTVGAAYVLRLTFTNMVWQSWFSRAAILEWVTTELVNTSVFMHAADHYRLCRMKERLTEKR